MNHNKDGVIVDSNLGGQVSNELLDRAVSVCLSQFWLSLTIGISDQSVIIDLSMLFFSKSNCDRVPVVELKGGEPDYFSRVAALYGHRKDIYSKTLSSRITDLASKHCCDSSCLKTCCCCSSLWWHCQDHGCSSHSQPAPSGCSFSISLVSRYKPEVTSLRCYEQLTGTQSTAKLNLKPFRMPPNQVLALHWNSSHQAIVKELPPE